MKIPDLSQESARRFLEALYADAVESHGLRFVLCVFGAIPEKQGEESRWREAESFGGATFDEAFAAAWRWIEQRASKPGGNIYAQMGMLATEVTGGKRGYLDDQAAIGTLWADIDVHSSAAHKAKKYATSYEGALSVTAIGGLAPSMVVDSGYGVHSYHLLDEPMVFESHDDNLAARIIANRYVHTIKANAKEQGFTIDSTQDLTRVLRVPGTINWKANTARPVRFMDELTTMDRYAVDSLEECMIAQELCDADQQKQYIEQVGVVRVRADAAMSPKVMALCMADTKFAETWEGERQDMKDQSPSAYDLSLANQMVAASALADDGSGFEDQEIVDTLIAWRRERGHSPKLRVDYYQRTLMRARSGQSRTQAIQQVMSPQELPPASPEQSTPSEREAMIHSISQVLRVNIVDIERIGRDPAVYTITLGDGIKVQIGSGHKAVKQDHWRGILAGECKVFLEPMKPDVWGVLCERIMQASKDHTEGAETTLDRFRELISDYWLDYGQDEDTRAEAQRRGRPYSDTGWIYMNGKDLKQWAMRTTGERYDIEALHAQFHGVGFERCKVSYRTIGGASTSRSYWRATERMLSAFLEISPAKSRDPKGIQNPDSEGIPI